MAEPALGPEAASRFGFLRGSLCNKSRKKLNGRRLACASNSASFQKQAADNASGPTCARPEWPLTRLLSGCPRPHRFPSAQGTPNKVAVCRTAKGVPHGCVEGDFFAEERARMRGILRSSWRAASRLGDLGLGSVPHSNLALGGQSSNRFENQKILRGTCLRPFPRLHRKYLKAASQPAFLS